MFLICVLQEDPSLLSHLLEALESGAPPHGGIALGEVNSSPKHSMLYPAIKTHTRQIWQICDIPQSAVDHMRTVYVYKAVTVCSQEPDHFHSAARGLSVQTQFGSQFYRNALIQIFFIFDPMTHVCDVCMFLFLQTTTNSSTHKRKKHSPQRMIILCQFALEGCLLLIHDKKTVFLAAYARISYSL